MPSLNDYLDCLVMFNSGRACIGIKVTPNNNVIFKGEAL